jgi:hypothetical protein
LDDISIESVGSETFETGELTDAVVVCPYDEILASGNPVQVVGRLIATIPPRVGNERCSGEEGIGIVKVERSDEYEWNQASEEEDRSNERFHPGVSFEAPSDMPPTDGGGKGEERVEENSVARGSKNIGAHEDSHEEEGEDADEERKEEVIVFSFPDTLNPSKRESAESERSKSEDERIPFKEENLESIGGGCVVTGIGEVLEIEGENGKYVPVREGVANNDEPDEEREKDYRDETGKREETLYEGTEREEGTAPEEVEINKKPQSKRGKPKDETFFVWNGHKEFGQVFPFNDERRNQGYDDGYRSADRNDEPEHLAFQGENELAIRFSVSPEEKVEAARENEAGDEDKGNVLREERKGEESQGERAALPADHRRASGLTICERPRRMGESAMSMVDQRATHGFESRRRRKKIRTRKHPFMTRTRVRNDPKRKAVLV